MAKPTTTFVCTDCGGEPHYLWQQRRDGGWHIRAECGRCGRFLRFAPQAEPFVGFADNTASETAVLDVLCQCDELEIDLHSDGRMVSFGPEGVTKHEDHVAIHQVGTEAFHRGRERSAAGFRRLLYAAIPWSRIRRFQEMQVEAGNGTFGLGPG